jgi:hypothetical protein
MSDKTEVQAAYDLGMSRTLDLVEIDGVKQALIPACAKVESFEHLLPAPTRIKALVISDSRTLPIH